MISAWRGYLATNGHLLWLCSLLALLATASGCDSSAPGKAAAKQQPEIVLRIDALLAKPYSEHFSNTQGDFSVAYQIGAQIEELSSHVTDPMRMIPLIESAGRLTKHANQESYDELVNEWKRTKPALRFGKK